MADDRLQLLLQHRRELFGFIRAMVRNTHDAEDIFQEVAQVVVKKAAGEEQIRDFGAWARGIARRQTKHFFRQRRQRRTAYLPTDEMLDLIGDAYSHHRASSEATTARYDALRECMKKLPEGALKALRLRFEGDQSYSSIATALKRSEVAVRRAVSRARRALVDCVFGRLRLQRET